MKFKYSSAAVTDLAEIIVQGTEVYGVKQSQKYALQLKSTIELLFKNPNIARIRSEFSRPIRIHPFGAHLIIYNYDDLEFAVLRILPNRSDVSRHINE